ncbi:hypothetical protein WAK64_02355 [Bacillus spongiae]|uniref:Uncharacterized protein n=1 Tax=Bacillus spongiae TaxID=2683610 RepID=A0ABU8H9P9_9BACI
MKKIGKLEAVLWGVAFPGFPQLILRQHIKGVLFVLLEIIININSSFNTAIMLSFMGETREAAQVIDYQWVLFYPCLYFFSMWDAYRNSLREDERYHYLPFAFAAYFVTVGVMYSAHTTLFDIFFGPVFLPMLFVLPGIAVGLLLRLFIIKWTNI